MLICVNKWHAVLTFFSLNIAVSLDTTMFFVVSVRMLVFLGL